MAKKYEAAAARNNLLFIPLVFSTYGNWTPAVDDFIRGLSLRITQNSASSSENIPTLLATHPINKWRNRVSVALHRAVSWQLHSRYKFLINHGLPESAHATKRRSHSVRAPSSTADSTVL